MYVYIFIHQYLSRTETKQKLSLSPRGSGAARPGLPPGGHLFLFLDRILFLYLYLILYPPPNCTEPYDLAGTSPRGEAPFALPGAQAAPPGGKEAGAAKAAPARTPRPGSPSP